MSNEDKGLGVGTELTFILDSLSHGPNGFSARFLDPEGKKYVEITFDEDTIKNMADKDMGKV